jgi:ribosomal protein S18 acetylase RimI-like enzyme
VSAALAIRVLSAADAGACDAIVESLPYHFGDAGGREQCARAVRESPGLVAVEDGRVIGFLAWRRPYPRSAEITWMAVQAGRRREGVGGALVAALVERLPDDVRHLLVTTLSPSTPEPDMGDTYAGTRRFYQANGFDPVWEPRGWWNDRNQALVMLRRVGG